MRASPVPLNAMIFNFYLFDRKGNCLCHREWKRLSLNKGGRVGEEEGVSESDCRPSWFISSFSPCPLPLLVSALSSRWPLFAHGGAHPLVLYEEMTPFWRWRRASFSQVEYGVVEKDKRKSACSSPNASSKTCIYAHLYVHS